MSSAIERKAVRVWSEGSRLAADMLRPAGGDVPRPAILFCHGWGGVKSHLLQAYSAAFVGAGYVCMFFDYRGWGESDGRIISTADTPMLTEAGPQTLAVRVIREVVDPMDQVADIRACLAYLLTEQGVDSARVGLWGSSYGGGLTTFVAGTDSRVKALVAQIGSYGSSASTQFREAAYKQMADKARGLIEPPVPQAVGAPTTGLRGVPDMARQLGYSPLKAAENIRVPTLFVDAEFEEYNVNEPTLQGIGAYEVVRQNAVCERVTYPCSHYKVYDQYLAPARQAAIDWFDKHL
jgi:dienelactone hydrolase